jgi:hypothetical protein
MRRVLRWFGFGDLVSVAKPAQENPGLDRGAAGRVAMGLPEQNKPGEARLVRREGSSRTQFLAQRRRLNALRSR